MNWAAFGRLLIWLAVTFIFGVATRGLVGILSGTAATRSDLLATGSLSAFVFWVVGTLYYRNWPGRPLR